MPELVIRTALRPGDLGYLIYRHGVLYAAEYGFDSTFEAYVAEPLGRFGRTRTARECLWVADLDGRAVGWIAVVKADETTAQLRWFLVEPEARGKGIGRKLIGDALRFCRDAAYERVILWTVAQLTAAARLYAEFGFVAVEEKAGGHCGPQTQELRYELSLTGG